MKVGLDCHIDPRTSGIRSKCLGSGATAAHLACREEPSILDQGLIKMVLSIRGDGKGRD